VAYLGLPPYSPDLNPIEPAWAVVKDYLHRADARSLDELDAAMPQALNQITPSNARGRFRLKGYRSN
jgi:transposase